MRVLQDMAEKPLNLTVGIFCQDGIGRQDRLGLSFFIDGRDLELIEMSGLETLGRRITRCALQLKSDQRH